MKYIDKNRLSIINGISSSDHVGDGPLTAMVFKKYDLKWFEIFFNLCSKVNTSPTEQDFESAINKWHFSKISKQHQSVIKENFAKFYPKP